MNRSYNDVFKCQINNSTSKQLYGFNKSPRFRKPNESPYQKKYLGAKITHMIQIDLLTTQEPTHLTSVNLLDLFIKKIEENPSPSAYRNQDFVEINQSKNKGPLIQKSQRIKQQDNKVPGPGSYVLNPQKNISYSMRARTKQINNNSWNRTGPGYYQQDKMGLKYSDSRYQNVKMGVLGKSRRFIQRQQEIPGPGKYNWEKVMEVSRLQTEPVSKYLKVGKYTFGKDRKGQLTITEKNRLNEPGPGAYYQFSQFAQLNKSPLSTRRNY